MCVFCAVEPKSIVDQETRGTDASAVSPGSSTPDVHAHVYTHVYTYIHAHPYTYVYTIGADTSAIDASSNYTSTNNTCSYLC